MSAWTVNPVRIRTGYLEPTEPPIHLARLMLARREHRRRMDAVLKAMSLAIRRGIVQADIT